MISSKDAATETAGNRLLREEIEQLRLALRNADSKLRALEEQERFLERRCSGDPLALLPGTLVQHRARSERHGIIVSEPDERGMVEVDTGHARLTYSVYALKPYVNEGLEQEAVASRHKDKDKGKPEQSAITRGTGAELSLSAMMAVAAIVSLACLVAGVVIALTGA